ncbi:MAG: serine hydrolase [Firmicutes bacterium]|nr:serine hydrolase [Bacillota bacterium]
MPPLYDAQAVIAPENIAAGAAVLWEATSGRLLWGRQPDAPLPPASTSKILTAVTVLDTADIRETARVSAKAAAVGESSIHLRQGERLQVEELLAGALMRSGNDACVALAEHTAGRESLFIDWLNVKAKTLGIYNAHLANSNGLPAENHLISAAALAKIAAYALQNETFAQIVSSKYRDIGSGGSFRRLRNTNKLLWQDDRVDGVKTGTTEAAGSCLIASRRQGRAHFISVVLHSPDRYGESLALLDYGAGHYQLGRLFAAGETVALLPLDGGSWQSVSVHADCWLLTAPEERKNAVLSWQFNPWQTAQAGEHGGFFQIKTADGQILATYPLYYQEAANR